MGKHRILRAAIIAALAAAPLAAGAEVTNEELLKRIEEQEQKILVLERKLEIQDEAAASAKEATPVVSAGPKGLQPQVGGRQEPAPPARDDASRRQVPRGRGSGRRRGQLPGDARASDDRGHVRRDLRLQVHAGLRPGPHGDPGRLRHRALQARPRSSPSASSSRRSASSACSRPTTCAGCSAAFRPASRRTATSGVQLGGDLAQRPVLVPGGLPERLERRLEQRDLRRRGHQRRQGIRAAAVRAPVRRERQLRDPRARHRHRRHLHGPGRECDAAAPAVLPDAGPVDVLPLPRGVDDFRRHDCRR